MTAPTPEKAAPIPADVLALAEAKSGYVGKLAWDVGTLGGLVNSVIARAIMQDRADREARPSLPDSREEHHARRWIAVDPTGLRGPERVTRLPQRANQWEQQGYVVTEWVRARQGGNNG